MSKCFFSAIDEDFVIVILKYLENLKNVASCISVVNVCYLLEEYGL